MDPTESVKLAAVGGLVVLGSVALLKGIDGPFMVGIAGVIGGIAGYQVALGKCQEKA